MGGSTAHWCSPRPGHHPDEAISSRHCLHPARVLTAPPAGPQWTKSCLDASTLLKLPEPSGPDLQLDAPISSRHSLPPTHPWLSQPAGPLWIGPCLDIRTHLKLPEHQDPPEAARAVRWIKQGLTSSLMRPSHRDTLCLHLIPDCLSLLAPCGLGLLPGHQRPA